MFIWYIFPVLVCLNQEKSGNPGLNFPKFLKAALYSNKLMQEQTLPNNGERGSLAAG
jgi:hypothetical protein